jgi:DnaJ homolog subfamily C member 13
MLDFLTYALCPPFSETTDGEHFDIILELVASHGRIFYRLFQHPSMAIVKGAGLVMKALIEEGTPEVAARMQELALSEGALPRHLHASLFTQSIDARMLTLRQLSRSLVALWCTSNKLAIDLIKRILPVGLYMYLYSSEQAPKDRDLLNTRDNLSLAIEHNNEQNQTTKAQLINRSRRLQKQVLNSNSVRLIEKQLSNAMQHWKTRVGSVGTSRADDKVVVLRRRRQRVKSSENWDLFYYKFNQDQAKPNLIWNFKCREELREAIENETRAFNNDKDLGQGYIIAWNYSEFEVPYNCLSEEIKIGEYYLRLLLESGSDIIENITKTLHKASAGGGEEKSAEAVDGKPSDNDGDQKNAESASNEANSQQSQADNGEFKEKELEIKNAVTFFNDLYHRFLLSSNMKPTLLQAMTIVYTKCYEEIGPFNDTKFIIAMLDRTVDRLERDHLLMFIDALILNKANVKEILDANGIRILVDLLTLAHLHTTRAYIPTQTNVIEASPDMERDTEKEWYYGNKMGPFSFKEMRQFYEETTIDAKTRCWAQG